MAPGQAGRTGSKKHNRKSSDKIPSSRRSTSNVQKTEILINVYDLLPPGKLSSTLWLLGSSLLHSGVVIRNREYAYGGHDRPGMSGVYWTRPRLEPPGGTFRLELLQGFTFRSEEEVEGIIRDVSQKFQGTAYNLLTKNCNHFTSYLCEQLTSRSGPSWLNRAASIGVALPCVVPREWIAPPEYDTADGELLDEEEEDERASMLRPESRQQHDFHGSSFQSDDGSSITDRDRRSGGNGGGGKGKSSVRDSDGRQMPATSHSTSDTGLLFWRHGKLGSAWIGVEGRRSTSVGAFGVLLAMAAETEIIAWTAWTFQGRPRFSAADPTDPFQQCSAVVDQKSRRANGAASPTLGMMLLRESSDAYKRKCPSSAM
ncbi:PPPDE putative peptidase domain [Lasallia pustulata]|uniref:PPPDE putative peptidase domain n=1 Tax=Lasallia pustulata TaxID=136370 RepID=A0A1W5CXV3_9LECA|nr:PPPDE putative peptidase domain [Lasallia pustulata]